MKITKKPVLQLAAVALLGALSACGNLLCLEGEGDVERRTLELSRFSGVEVSGGTKVYIRQGNQQSVEVRGQANILDELDTEVQGDGTWEIEFERCLGTHETVEVYITVPELEKASVGGSGTVELVDVFKSRSFQSSVSGSGSVLLRLATENLDARISGSGTIRAAGVADVQDVSISGSGKYLATDLDSRRVEVSVSGSGRAEVEAEDRLEADISGSGRVYYSGSPDVRSSVSGSGKVIKK
ncbi:head GIN domain-containing protein [Pontibacter kalidii]|uniref:head GIN domain-containing protein n=1 Tax=Pontibacter kalidii TaxID=2592049 RepID=UPI00225BC50D|nr:head GIN domain-containing protein [Pontibacter kalidii]